MSLYRTTLIVVAALAGVVIELAPAYAQPVPITYVRCARTHAPMTLTGEVVIGGVRRQATRTMIGVDVYDVLPDVSHFFGDFSGPCDLVLRQPSGEERILYDCSSTSTDAASCAAMDPAVSFDGKTIAFTVFRGELVHPGESVHAQVVDPAAENNELIPTAYPNRILRTTEAQLHLVDVATGVVTPLPHMVGDFDTGPAFLANGRLAFTSTRDGSWTTKVFGVNASGIGSRIWTMDLDGRNVDLASHHGLAQEQHPYPLRDGRLLYSSWQIFGGLPFRHGNGTVGGFTTLSNLFHLYTQRPDGAVPFAFYGQHSGDHSPTTSIGSGHNAAHFVTQASDGRVWFADYYRGNNNGLGAVIGVMPEPDGQEGMLPTPTLPLGDYYAPRDAINLAPWTGNFDQMAFPLAPPGVSVATYADPIPFTGKLGHPAALPDNGLMVVWGKGPCSTVATNNVFAALGRTAPPKTSGSGQGVAMNVITSLGLDTPGCDAGIYRVTQIPSQHPSDLEPIVDSREWHELQPRAVVPYAAIHGVDHPDVLDRADKIASRPELEVGTPFGLLGAASILDRETHPAGGIHFAGVHQFNLQGTDTIDYDDDALCGVRILAVLPNRGRETNTEIASIAGERLAILGEVAVQHRDAAGAARLDASGNPDTSFLVRFPANVPYLMQAIDCEGRTLNTDQTWQSLRPGEVKTCGGCHVHSRPSRVAFETTFAATADYSVPSFGRGEVPLLAGAVDGVVTTRTVPGYGLQIDFTRDILPIFARRCVSCHGGAAPAGNLVLDRPGVSGPPVTSTWWCLVADRSQQCVPSAQRFDTGLGTGTTLQRPQVTRYVRAFNALGSLLYWKAAGRRTDGRTDATYDATSPRDDRDLDFGPAHPTTITAEELGLLGRWIDLGAPGGPGELRDTQRPTLHLSAIVAGDAVTELRIGTVDVGSGIDVGSLEVCIVEGQGCAAETSPAADAHGVVAITLAAPLTDLDRELEARVRDLAGNETVVRRTVRWLLDAPPPPDPDDANTGDTRAGGCGCNTGSSPASLVYILIALLAIARPGRSSANRSPSCSRSGAAST